ncbi:MAG: hypothetical protein ABSB41_09060 [Anaerolineales bacterium]|jgi:hypothetical protein
MSSFDNPAEGKLRQAAEFIRIGRQKEARQLLREVLVADRNNLTAWELLFNVAHNNEEKTFCLKAILTLRPDHPWARQQLTEINPAAAASPEASTQANPPLHETAPTQPAPLPGGVVPEEPEKRNSSRFFVAAAVIIFGLLCVGLVIIAVARFGVLSRTSSPALTATALAAHDQDCQALIQQAVQASGSSCQQIGSNKVCYGNDTIQADLIPSASERFVQRGDVVDIGLLRSLSASPLELDKHQWGIAVFKVIANLPRSLPGETVTMLVFGNTLLDNGTGSLEAFHFSSEFGQIVCNKVNLDGIMVTMPKGQGVHFTVNGAELTLMGDASFKAAKNGEMQVSLYSGAGSIVSQGQQQYFGAGQKVSVQLGGPGGSDAVSPPSTPEPLSGDELNLACSMGGQYCSSSDISPVSPAEAQAMVDAGMATSTPTASSTPAPTSTTAFTATSIGTPTVTGSPTHTPTITSTSTHTLTPTTSLTPSRTSTGAATRTSSLTPTKTATKTPLTPTDTYTPVPPTNTYSPLPPTDTYTPAPPTNTYTPLLPTDTYTPVIPTHTHTPVLPTHTHTPMPIFVVILDPATDGNTLSNNGQTLFQAEAYDPNVGTNDGDGIDHVNFWFSGPHPPSIGSHTENASPFCAFSNTGLSCDTMDNMHPGLFHHLQSGTYTMYVQAFSSSGHSSAVISRTFNIP